MKYNYTLYRDPLGSLRIRLPERIDMFSDFISLIATEERANQIIQIIDEVQEGKHDEYGIFYNAPTVLIKPEVTSVSLSDILDDPPPDQYIETDEFRELILIWKEKIPERFLDKDTEE